MASRSNDVMERFFTALISGDRVAARDVIGEVFEADCSAEQVAASLYWPVLQQIQKIYREDRLTNLAYHYATRLLRALIDQLQLHYQQQPRNGITAMVVSGAEDAEEIAAQLTSDMLEASGYTVHYAGGGIANDEIVEQLGEIQAQKLVIFGAIPATVPQTRLLIDRLHSIGSCPNLQIVVGGGVFNRADGLAEEIGADLWAGDPGEIVSVMQANPQRRMTSDQRTVGRKRRPAERAAA